MIGIIARVRSVSRATVTPQRTTDRAHASPSGTLLLPQLLPRPGHFMPRLGFYRAAAALRQVMANRFVQQRFIYRSCKNCIRQLQAADLVIVEIENIDAWHGY